MKLRKIFDSVYETEVYKKLDYDYAGKFFEEKYDGWNFTGGCTAATKVLPGGDTVTCRNMDLTISNKAAYIVRTNCEGKYSTVGLSYINMFGPENKDVEREGLDNNYTKLLPFLCTDIMNSKGLYIETNMRMGEFDEKGVPVFGCPGTNPDAQYRVCSMVLPRYLCEHCANVDEAIDSVQNYLDIYTDTLKGFSWNFCFMISDPSGKYGLLEIAKNKVSWLPGQQAQANFYITKEFFEQELYRCGLFRYDSVMNILNSASTEEDMFNIIDNVTYLQVYSRTPKFDVRSEYIGIEDDWTTSYVLDPKNKDIVQARIDKNINKVQSATRQELKNMNMFWETVFTVVANCNKKTMNVRFFENNDYRYTLSFEN